jgi:hypothetical protein
MSIEYLAPLPTMLSSHVSAAIRSAIQNNGAFSITRDIGTEMGLRRNDTTLAVEHATLQITTEGLYIAFHAATLPQRDSLLQAIRLALRQHGLQVAWQEL